MKEVGLGEGGVRGEGLLDSREATGIDRVGVGEVRTVMDKWVAEDGVEADLARGLSDACFNEAWDVDSLAQCRGLKIWMWNLA